MLIFPFPERVALGSGVSPHKDVRDICFQIPHTCVLCCVLLTANNGQNRYEGGVIEHTRILHNKDGRSTIATRQFSTRSRSIQQLGPRIVCVNVQIQKWSKTLVIHVQGMLIITVTTSLDMYTLYSGTIITFAHAH